jgi:hypothetical protein
VVDFSSAMARQAMDEALHELPPQHNQVLKLAYFAGLTNREIAQELGVSVSEVRNTLRGSLASVGAHLDRGRARGRRAIQDLAMLPWWRGLGESVHRMPWPAVDHVLQTGVVAVMTAAAVALLVTHQAPAQVGHTHKTPHVTAVGSAGSSVHQAHLPAPVHAQGPASATQPVVDVARQPGSLPVSAGALTVSVPLPISITTPVVFPKVRVHGIPQLPFGA